MRLSAHGITTDLPAGWEGRITRRTIPTGGPEIGPGPNGRRAGHDGSSGEIPQPVVHLANFALPEQRGDYGSGAVDLMGTGHLFLTLFEFGPESVGKALFDPLGIPHLRPDMFDARTLQRTLEGQAGSQHFFTVANRAFSLYVVLGDRRDATRLTPAANAVLSRTTVAAR